MRKLILIVLILMFNFSPAAEQLILNKDPNFIPDFKSRFSILAGLNPSMFKANQVKNVHLAYARQEIDNRWWDYSFNYTLGYFNKLTTNNPTATTLNSSQFADETNTSQIGLGVGINYETHYIRTLVPFEGMYELMGASFVYNIFKDPLSASTFTGPGIIAKYSVLKKFSDYVSIGGNFIYNLAVVKRSQNTDTENSSSRSLTLSHLTVGIDLSFYL